MGALNRRPGSEGPGRLSTEGRMTRIEARRLSRGSGPAYWLGRCDWCGLVRQGLYDLKRELADRGLGEAAVLVGLDKCCGSCTAAALAAARLGEEVKGGAYGLDR